MMIELRSLSTVDAATLHPLITGYTAHQQYRVNRIISDRRISFTLDLIQLDKPLVKRYNPPEDDTISLYQEVVREGYSFGAYNQDRLIGVAIASMQEWNGALHVYELHIAESHRGQGVGRRLIEALADKARSGGGRVLVCETQNTNIPAIQFYERMGFVLDGIDLSYYTNDDWPDGEVALFMKRRL